MAPISGTVIAPPRKRDEQDQPGQLRSWRGTPLDDHNTGCYLQTGETFCMIGNPEQLEAILIIDQESMQFVAKDQRVRILLDQSPGTIAQGQIVELAKIDMKVAPRELHDGRYLWRRPQRSP